MKLTNKEIWIVVYPILLSLMMEHLINLTDTAFLGRVGEVELGASALAGVYYMAIYMLGFGFSIGAQILIARRNGEGRYDEIGKVFYQGVLFLLLLAVVMFTVSRCYSPVVLRHLIDSEQVYEATVKYTDWRVFGFFFSFVAVMFRAFYVGITETSILTINSVVMVLTNVVLNYILIFGKFGMPALGIEGAAIGSSVSELVSVLFFVIYTWKRVDGRKYGFFHFGGFQAKVLFRILSISIWTMLQAFISIATWFLFFVAVEHLGERPLAVSNIVRSIGTLFFMPVTAFATTSSSLVSNLIGAGRPELVFPACMKIIRMCFMLIGVLLLFTFIFPETVLRIYTDDASLIQSAKASLFVMSLGYFIAPAASILFHTISGTGNTRWALYVEFATLLVYIAYIVYVVVYLKAEVAVCWTADVLYWIVLFIFSWWYMKRASWQKKSI